MRLVIQRVAHASVTIPDDHGDVTSQPYSRIGAGLMVLVGVGKEDTREDAMWLAAKTVAMRIFPDDEGVMNRSLIDCGGDLLAVSQFTLLASTRKGNRPSYINAAGHDLAIPLYELYCEECSRLLGREVKRGVFGADMKVELLNDGPVTIVIDSKA